MLTEQVKPKNKNDLVRAIQRLYNPKIEVVEVNHQRDAERVLKEIKQSLNKGSVSVVILTDR